LCTCALAKNKEQSHSENSKLKAAAKAEQTKLKAAVKASVEKTKKLQASVREVKKDNRVLQGQNNKGMKKSRV